MIVKQIVSKGKGSFVSLATYLLDVKNKGEKMEDYAFSNCPFELIKENVSYIKQMQELNQMVQSDKSLHLVVSFKEEEHPSKEVLEDIEEEFLKVLDMQEHHRLSVTHSNTNNFHMHIAINRLNPDTGLLVNPWKSKMKLQKKAQELEEKHKLQKDKHPLQFEEILKKEDENQSKTQKHKYKDQEIHSGMKNLLTWIQEEVLEEIKELIDTPQSELKDLQELLAQYNLEIKPRGNGLVIGDKKRKLFVKASDVHRMLSKKSLERRFEVFKQYETSSKVINRFGKPKSSLWEDYQKLIEQRKIAKVDELNLEKKSRLDLRERIGLKYKNKLDKIRNNPTRSSSQKYQQRASIYAHQKAELKELSERFSQKRKFIHKTNRLFTYKEFLLERALGGDELSLEALRRTKMMFKPNENILRHPQGKINHKIWESLKLQISKEGKAVYAIEGNGKVIDTGSYLKIVVEDNDRSILTSLQMAKEKFGERLDVQGSLAFKKRVMMVNEQYELNIDFVDKQMQGINKKSKGFKR